MTGAGGEERRRKLPFLLLNAIKKEKPSNSRVKTLVIWTFLGFVLACGWVLAKGYWPKLKESFAYTNPWSVIAPATFMKPAMLAPFT